MKRRLILFAEKNKKKQPVKHLNHKWCFFENWSNWLLQNTLLDKIFRLFEHFCNTIVLWFRCQTQSHLSYFQNQFANIKWKEREYITKYHNPKIDSEKPMFVQLEDNEEVDLSKYASFIKVGQQDENKETVKNNRKK